MLCQRCKKEAATFHLTEIVKQETRERHLCDGCAQTEGLAIKQSPVDLSGMLAQFVLQPGIQELAQLSCPKCKMTFVEFRSSGLLGCAEDYDAFERALLPLIERAHEGNTRHTGKTPQRLGAGRNFQNDLVRLRRDLARALRVEDYETAARLRDQINVLQSR